MSSSSSRSASAQPFKGAYYPSWDETLTPAGIETKYFTHIFYAFLNPEDRTFNFNISRDEARRLRNFTNTLHAKRPAVKTLFAVGGATAGTGVLSRMASNAQSRAAFIRSSIKLARGHGFDGVDLDWEYPANETDMDNLRSLLEEWRVEVRNDARASGEAPLLLTASVYFEAVFSWGERQEYPAPSMAENLDFINVMTFDFYGKWDNPMATGAHAALYEPSPKANMSIRLGVESWMEAGVPASKLVMGLPLYGRTWRLENPRLGTGLGAPAVGVGPGDEDGLCNYDQVVRFNRQNGATVVQHQETGSVYSYAGNIWISYDDTWSVANKIDYAKNLGLAGYFFWDVCGDDQQWTISRTASQSWPR